MAGHGLDIQVSWRRFRSERGQGLLEPLELSLVFDLVKVVLCKFHIHCAKVFVQSMKLSPDFSQAVIRRRV